MRINAGNNDNNLYCQEGCDNIDGSSYQSSSSETRYTVLKIFYDTIFNYLCTIYLTTCIYNRIHLRKQTTKQINRNTVIDTTHLDINRHIFI